MANLFLARVCIDARHDQICVIREFEDPVPAAVTTYKAGPIAEPWMMLAWMTATADICPAYLMNAVGMIIEKVHGPVDAVRQLQLGQFARQRRMPDRMERLWEVKRIDVDKVVVYQHIAYGV